jgi:hypothetical protein
MSFTLRMNDEISGAMNYPCNVTMQGTSWQIKTPLEIYQILIIYFCSILAACFFENVKKWGGGHMSSVEKTRTMHTTRMQQMPAYALRLLTVLLCILRRQGIILLYIICHLEIHK